MKKNSWQLPVLALMIMLVRVNSVSAYLTGSDTALNRTRAVGVMLHISEEYEPPDQLQPGISFRKRPAAVNDSSIPVYVRARVLFSSSNAEMLCQPLVIGQGWRYDGGLYYYETPLAPSSSTQPLFTEVGIRQDVSREMIDAGLPFEIYVYAECVPAGDQTCMEAFEEAERGKES